ncbi:MAG: DUF2846 domain-containing protein [Acidobacteriota bacterium]
MKRYGVLFFVLLAAMFAGTSPTKASDKYTVLKDKPLDASRRPAEGKALIYFARPQMFGAAFKVKLYADGTFLGIVGPRTYIAYDCDPGKHEFIVAAENAGFLEANVEAGKIYIVQVAIHMGAWKARTHFEPARTGSEAMEEFLKEASKLHAVVTTDEGLEWVNEKHAKTQKTIKKYRAKGKEFETLKSGDGFDSPPWVK